MASKRNLKKDIDNLIYEIVADCYSYMELYPQADHKPVKEMAEKAFDLQDDTLTKINMHKGSEDSKETRKFFNEIKTEFIDQANKMFSELDELYKSQEDKK